MKTELTNLDKKNCSINEKFSFHPSFYRVFQKLQKRISRFPFYEDTLLYEDLNLFYLLAEEKYLNHREDVHFFRLILSLHFMQKDLQRSSAISRSRYMKIKWIPTKLFFPFSSKPVLGSLVGFNQVDRYELFDEENLFLVLQKHFPQIRLVKESAYTHVTSNKELKLFYFEIEKDDGSFFRLQEQIFLRKHLEQKLKNSIQRLSPMIFMRRNEEEVYKNILVLSQQIQSIKDLPQALISFDQQSEEEVTFLIIAVYVSPSSNFSLQNCFTKAAFTSEKVLVIRHLRQHPIEASIFHIHLKREASLLRSDGSLDYYESRQKVVAIINEAIGEFRDYNGGILVKQQELLHYLKQTFHDIALSDLELIESFFYAITPIEQQALLQPKILSKLFTHFISSKKESLFTAYTFKVIEDEKQIFLSIKVKDTSIKEILLKIFLDESCKGNEIIYNNIEIGEYIYFQCVLLYSEKEKTQTLIQTLQKILTDWELKVTAPSPKGEGF